IFGAHAAHLRCCGLPSSLTHGRMRALRCSAAPSIWTTWSPNLSPPTPQRSAARLTVTGLRRSASRLTQLDFVLLSIYWVAIGTVGDVIFLVGIALSGSYWLVVVFYFLLQTSSNTAQGPYQGLLPDVVPEDQRGVASGYYGISNVLGLLLGTVGAGYILAHAGRTAAILSICVVLLVTMLPTVLLVPDRAEPKDSQFKSAWEGIRTTFTRPLGHRSFLWLVTSRLLILMGLG